MLNESASRRKSVQMVPDKIELIVMENFLARGIVFPYYLFFFILSSKFSGSFLNDSH